MMSGRLWSVYIDRGVQEGPALKEATPTKPFKSSPSHMLVMGHALLLGAITATGQAIKDDSVPWSKRCRTCHCALVTVPHVAVRAVFVFLFMRLCLPLSYSQRLFSVVSSHTFLIQGVVPFIHVDWCLERNGLDLSAALLRANHEPANAVYPKCMSSQD